jgi:hypothetical protein
VKGSPGGVPPPQKDAAAPGGTGAAVNDAEQKQKHEQYSKTDADRLFEMTIAVCRDGELWRYLPTEPKWYRRVGAELFSTTAARRDLTPKQRHRLEFVYRLGSARRRGAEIGSTYVWLTHASVEEARCALQAAFDDILVETLEYHAAMTRMAA